MSDGGSSTAGYDYECMNKKAGRVESVDIYQRSQANVGSSKFSPACFSPKHYIKAQHWSGSSWSPMVKREMTTPNGLLTSNPVLYDYMRKLYWSTPDHSTPGTAYKSSYATQMPPNPGAPYRMASELLQHPKETSQLVEKKKEPSSLSPPPPPRRCTHYLQGKHYGAPGAKTALPVCKHSGCFQCVPLPSKTKKSSKASEQSSKESETRPEECYRSTAPKKCKKGMQGMIDDQCRCVKAQKKAEKNRAAAAKKSGEATCKLCGANFGDTKEGRGCQESCIEHKYVCPKYCEPSEVFSTLDKLKGYFDNLPQLKAKIDKFAAKFSLKE